MKRRKIHPTWFALAIFLAAGLCAAEEPPKATAEEIELEATESAFARTMAERDHAAFVSFLAEDTVFFDRNGLLRGRDAVADAWKPFFSGESAPFSWHPDTVAVRGSGGLGFTSGPVTAPDGTRLGTFNSVWKRQEDGRWKIIFDKGCPPCGDRP